MPNLFGLSAVTLVSCTASVTGGTCLLVTQYKMRSLHYGLRNLLSFLTVSDLLTALGYIVGTVNFITVGTNEPANASNDIVCKIQSFVTTSSNMSSFAWTSIITIHLYLLVGTERNWDKSVPLKLFYHMIGWTIPAIIALVMLTKGYLGNGDDKTTGPWCWIRINQEPKSEAIVMIFSGKFWEILTYVLSFTIFVLLKYKTYIKRRNKRPYKWHEMVADPASLRQEDARLCYIWLPLYLLRIWGTIRFFFEITNDSLLQKSRYQFLLYLQCIGDSSHAFANFILFCLCDKEIRASYRAFCRRRYHFNESGRTMPTISVPYQSIASTENWMGEDEGQKYSSNIA